MAETCPKCGYADVPGDECPRCRVIVSKYRAHLQSLGTGGVATLVAAPAPSAPPSQWRPSPAGGGPGGVGQPALPAAAGCACGVRILVGVAPGAGVGPPPLSPEPDRLARHSVLVPGARLGFRQA